MEIFESGEMYLENLLILTKAKKIVHAVDLSENMHISRASVSRALAKLEDGNYIEISEKGELKFTKKGLSVAKKIYERHVVITDFLVSLGVDHETAQLDACRMEHVIGNKTFDAIKRFTMSETEEKQ